MSDDRNGKVVTVGVTLAFVGLAAAFLVDLWGHPSAIVEIPTVKSVFINTNTVRLSAGELIASEGDVSGMDCYACQDRKSVV